MFVIDQLIEVALYLFILMGTYLIVSPLFIIGMRKQRMVRRYRNMVRSKNGEKTGWIRHLQMLISVTLNTSSDYALLTFFSISIGLGAVSFIFLFQSGVSILLSVFFSILGALIPYVVLRVLLHNIRITSSYEAEPLLTELVNQYKINHFNMMEAIDKTIPYLDHAPHSQRALFRLSLNLKQYRSDDELDMIIQEFYFSIKTDWSILLSNCIVMAIEHGDNVKEALEDILQDVRELKEIFENNKRLNSESYFMIKFVSPATFLLTIYLTFSTFNFTLEKYVAYQFQHSLGLKFFVITAVGLALNFVIYHFTKRPKFDF